MMTLEMDRVEDEIICGKFYCSNFFIDATRHCRRYCHELDVPLVMAFNQQKIVEKLFALSTEVFSYFYFLCSLNDE